MLNGDDVSTESSMGIEKIRRRIEKEEMEVVLIEKSDSSLLLYVETDKKRVAFKILCFMQKYKKFRSVTVFIADIGVLINFSAQDIRRGWTRIFRGETESHRVWLSNRKIIFHFNAQFKKILPVLGDIKKSALKGVLKKGHQRNFAEYVSGCNSCSISFVFSQEAVIYFQKIIRLPTLLKIQIEEI